MRSVAKVGRGSVFLHTRSRRDMSVSTSIEYKSQMERLRKLAKAKIEPYSPPQFCAGLSNIPTHRIRLVKQTPIEDWPLDLAGAQETKFFVKRDDDNGFSLSGNKIRKLEFLLADALNKGHDSVITIGGVQSNHCRATAMAARKLGLEPYLLLRNKVNTLEDTMEGNLMLSRMIGATIRVFTIGELHAKGYDQIMNDLADELRAQGKNPYLIPVGGSTALGTWGYIEAAAEVLNQQKELNVTFDDIVVSIGSGGTAAGLAAGFALSKSNAKVYGMCACDDTNFFHDYINKVLFSEMKPPFKSEDVLTVIEDYKGIGYAKSTKEELEIIYKIARDTSVLLDPVYSGKAAIAMIKEHDRRFRGRRVLFIHTGGGFGMYEKTTQLKEIVQDGSTVSPMYK